MPAGTKVTIMYKARETPHEIVEQEHVVQAFRRFLPDQASRAHGLVQFFAVQGGQRTVRVKDIVELRQP